ncbi:MAG: hypothetical protein CBB60_002100 [Armatimonadetes bacterium Cent15-Ar3]|nr:MAG: hypothetical protein CBB60_002100 [Armatimonadetes bacterium Cent15-Ar3]
MPISRFCEFARSCGADSVEILDAFWYEPGVIRDYIPDTSTFESELESALDGIKVGAVAVTNDFVHSEPERIAVERAKIELGLSVANRFGAGVVRVFSAHPSADDADSSRDRAIANLGSINSADRTLALENHGVVFGTPAEVLAISKGAGTGICFDIGNWLLAGVDPVKAALEMPFPDLIHVKDFVSSIDGPFQSPDGGRLSGAFLGQGCVPIVETLRALFQRSDRRAVPIHLELECGDRGVEATREGIAWLRSTLSQL